jgi:hypothetical protein
MNHWTTGAAWLDVLGLIAAVSSLVFLHFAPAGLSPVRNPVSQPLIMLTNPMTTTTSASKPRTIRHLGMTMFCPLLHTGADRPLQGSTFAKTGDEAGHYRQRRQEQCGDRESVSH